MWRGGDGEGIVEVEVRGFRRGVEVDGVCGGVCGVRGGNMAVVSRAEDRENGSEAGEGAAGAAGGGGRVDIDVG